MKKWETPKLLELKAIWTRSDTSQPGRDFMAEVVEDLTNGALTAGSSCCCEP